MKKSKLFKKLHNLFSAKARENRQQRQELQDSLQLIKKKQKELKALLQDCHDPDERKALQEKISILQAQRGKGINKLRNPETN